MMWTIHSKKHDLLSSFFVLMASKVVTLQYLIQEDRKCKSYNMEM